MIWAKKIKYIYYEIHHSHNNSIHSLFNSLTPERCGSDFENVIKLIMGNTSLCTRSEIALRLMPQNLTNYKSTLVQVMAWCCQATSLYLGQCWLKSISPYVFTRPQCTTSVYKMYTKSVILTKGCSVKPHKHLLINSYHTLTHWGRVTHICVSKLTIIGSDNGLSPDRRQAIISTNAGIMLIGPLGTNVSEILIKILTFSFKKMRLNVSSGKWRSFFSASMC